VHATDVALQRNAGRIRAGLSKLNSVRPLIVEVDVVLGELSVLTVSRDHRRAQRLPP